MIDDLNRGLPLEIQDARPADRGSIQPQLSLEFARTRQAENISRIRPQLQYGFSSNGHLQVASQQTLGAGEKAENGEIQVGALYRVSCDESGLQLAFYGELELPTESESGIDSEIESMMTQPILYPEMGAHLNLTWVHNASPRISEREHGYRFVLGFHRKFSETFLMVADFARTLRKQQEDVSTLLELGGLGLLSKTLEWGLGLGAGLGEASPQFRITVSFEYSFGGKD